MPSGSRLKRSVTRCLVILGASLAIGGQATVVLASLADARSESSIGPHVEMAGTSIHYVHDETCAICQAKSLQALAARVPESAPTTIYRCAAFVLVAHRVIVLDRSSPISSRAPPRVS